MPRILSFEVLDQRRVLTAMPTFALVDSNPASDTHGQAVSPQQFHGEVTAWYFAHANCSYCTAQYGHLDTLQQQLEDAYPQLKIQLLGVNEAGFEAYNDVITAGKTIPWLQDTDANQNGQSDVWMEKWQTTFRDVVVLNGQGEKVGVYNLTSHNLATEANFTELKTLLVDAALQSQLPWHNKTMPYDVNKDNVVAPIDALLVIIALNTHQNGKLQAPEGSSPIATLIDTNGDGFLAPLDALLVINQLNAVTQPQGESPIPEVIDPSEESTARSVLDWLAFDQLASRNALDASDE